VLNRLRALSSRDELIIVVAGAFGYFIVVSILIAITNKPGAPLSAGADFKHLLVHELIILVMLSTFLGIRGWTFERIGLGPNLRETLIGLGLTVIIMFTDQVVWAFAAITSSHVLEAGRIFNPVEGSIEPAIVIAVSIVNPIFEEFFLCGYLVTALKDRAGPWTAINISVGIRLLCHLYQGMVGVIFIVPFGLILTYWYARQGRLWPLIVAHVVFDFFPLLEYAK
jgi:uncharacterized protein